MLLLSGTHILFAVLLPLSSPQHCDISLSLAFPLPPSRERLMDGARLWSCCQQCDRSSLAEERAVWTFGLQLTKPAQVHRSRITHSQRNGHGQFKFTFTIPQPVIISSIEINLNMSYTKLCGTIIIEKEVTGFKRSNNIQFLAGHIPQLRTPGQF